MRNFTILFSVLVLFSVIFSCAPVMDNSSAEDVSVESSSQNNTYQCEFDSDCAEGEFCNHGVCTSGNVSVKVEDGKNDMNDMNVNDIHDVEEAQVSDSSVSEEVAPEKVEEVCEPQEEECNNKDDDCDGQVDEGLTQIKGQTDEGLCTTCVQYCIYGEWTSCEVVMPSEDTCDNKDNDCDGEVDEDFDKDNDVKNCGQCGHECMAENATAQCLEGKCVYACLPGWIMIEGSCSYNCVVTNDGVEQCDNIDNNCDGQTDEGLIEIYGETDEGECTQCESVCENGTWSVCDFIKSAEEKCDNKDNDCDGETDEDFDLQLDLENCGECGQKCQATNAYSFCNEGECVYVCWPGWYDLEGKGCDYGCFPTNDGGEMCDKIDNDCDGEIDEDWDLSIDVENCGSCGKVCGFDNAQFACEKSECKLIACIDGFYNKNQIDSDGCEYECTPSGLEDCDGIDNDCDGSIDEYVGCGCVNGQTMSCNEEISYVGDCKGFQQICENGVWSECYGSVMPVEEVCDNHDNDCDGETDEGFDLLSDPKNCGFCSYQCDIPNAVALCTEGQCYFEECQENYYDLKDEKPGCEYSCQLTGEEVCDEVDNDCDGEIDETFNLETDPLNCGECGKICKFYKANEVGCQDGQCYISQCEEGWHNRNEIKDDGCEYQCDFLGEEVCNKIDDNCDGSIDEGIECPCYDDEKYFCNEEYSGMGECTLGMQTCEDNILSECKYAVFPVGEICDYKDNDCDGEIDEDFNLQTDVNNCGLCGYECSFAHATASCVEGECVMGACEFPYYNFNQDETDGCEVACLVTGVEQCDGIDNDCDNQIDEDFNFENDFLNCGECGHKCDYPNVEEAVCENGGCNIISCKEGYYDLNNQKKDGCEYKCTSSGEEVCDGLDNDCDGSIDNGIDCACVNDSIKICNSDYAIYGTCTLGYQYCEDGVWSECKMAIYPQNDICDGLDNDCDGKIDEDYSLEDDAVNCGSCGNVCSFYQAGSSCQEGKCVMGSCFGFYYDINKEIEDGCEYGPCVTSGVEKCDGLDNDCDSLIDEEFNLQTDVNNCGSCNNKCSFYKATSSCVEGKCVMGECEENYYNLNEDDSDGCEFKCKKQSDEEDCGNTIDDNCDGSVNETCDCFNGQMKVCGETSIGECEKGIQICENGVWSECLNQVLPVVEKCDGLDNNCDGKVDEDFEVSTDINNCGECGNVCEYFHGKVACVQGKCQLQECEEFYYEIDEDESNGCEYGPCVDTGSEKCDYIDNDCNGVVDDDWDLKNDPKNCGACGNDCTKLWNVEEVTCEDWGCQIVSCVEGYEYYNNHCQLIEPDFMTVKVCYDLDVLESDLCNETCYGQLAWSINGTWMAVRDVHIDAEGCFIEAVFDNIPSDEVNTDITNGIEENGQWLANQAKPLSVEVNGELWELSDEYIIDRGFVATKPN